MLNFHQTFTWRKYQQIQKELGAEEASAELEKTKKMGRVIVKVHYRRSFRSLLPFDHEPEWRCISRINWLRWLVELGYRLITNINYNSGYAILKPLTEQPNIAGTGKANLVRSSFQEPICSNIWAGTEAAETTFMMLWNILSQKKVTSDLFSMMEGQHSCQPRSFTLTKLFGICTKMRRFGLGIWRWMVKWL